MLTLYQTIISTTPDKQELFITREFDATREVVFKAFTDPNIFVQWLGPRDLIMSLEEFEPRNGGTWRYIHKDHKGNLYGFHGVFHEITPPERIIQTFEYEGQPEKGHVSLEITRFEELPGNRTKLTVQAVYLSIEDRDDMLQADMARGVNESYEQLDELLTCGILK